jgi:hypothetical protein
MLYEGQFKNHQWNGYGRAIFDDGRYHVGFFKNDRRNGPGLGMRLNKKNGSDKKWIIEEGIWENDVLKDIKRQETVENTLGFMQVMSSRG